jgi:hypothetical protein
MKNLYDLMWGRKNSEGDYGVCHVAGLGVCNSSLQPGVLPRGKCTLYSRFVRCILICSGLDECFTLDSTFVRVKMGSFGVICSYRPGCDVPRRPIIARVATL